MALAVIALPATEYDAWLAHKSAPAAEPTGEVARRGQSLFQAAGCGTCHTIRGTGATGTIGPDLTHIGGRRSVGVDTLPVTAANITRFITNGQHVKPGNRMPEFRVLNADDQNALAAYLVGLR
jgi:cytochrome c oxidase subunit 2